MTAKRERERGTRRGFVRRGVAWLSGLLLVLALVVTAALTALFSFEQSTLRPLAEYLVESATGRQFSIAGDLQASAGRIVGIRAARISLANADWGSRDILLSIDEAEVTIDLWRVLNGMPAIDRVEASGVELLFEQDEQGRSNWALGKGADLPAPAPATRSRDGIVLPVLNSRLSDVAITVNSAALEEPLEVRFESIEHDAASADELRATALGAVEDHSLNLRARIGPLSQMLGAGAVDFDISADLDTLALEASGEVDSLLAPRQANLRISLETEDISQIYTLLGLPGTASGASELEFNMMPSGDHHAIDLAASVASLRLDARGRLQALDTLDGASIEVSAAGEDLGAAARLAGLKGFPGQPFEFESSASLSGRQLTLGETHLDSGDNHLTAEGSMNRFPELGGTDLEIRLVGKNYLEFAALLGVGEVATLKPEPFELSSSLEYTGRDLQQFEARLTLADLSGEFSGELTGNPAFAGSHLDYRLEGRNDGLVQRMLGRPTGVAGTYALQGNLQRTSTGFGIESAALSFGANELEISGKLGEEPLRDGSDLSVHFHGPDLDKIAAIAGYADFMPAGMAEIDAAARTLDNTVHVDELEVQLGRNRLKASGLVNSPDVASGSRAEVALSGEDIADVLPPDLLAFVDARQAYELTATLAADSGQVSIGALRARLGEVRLEASGRVSATRPLSDMSMALDVRGPDLAAIVPEDLVPYRLPAAEFSVNGGVALTADGLALDGIVAQIGADRLDLSGIVPLDTPTDGLNLAVAASGPNLRRAVPAELGEFDFVEQPYEIAGNVGLAKGVLSLRQLAVSTPRGKLSGRLSLSVENPRGFGEFDLRASGSDLREFAASTPDYQPAKVAFDVDARGKWDSERVAVERGIIRLDDARIEVAGEVDLPPGVTATRLEFSARGDNLSDLGQFRALVLPAEEFRIDASLRGDADDLEIPRLVARLGDSDLHGSLRIGFAEKPKIEIELESEKLELAKLLPPEDGLEENETSAQPAAGDGRLIPQIPVPADQLNRIDLEVSIRMGELRLPRSTLWDIEIDTSLRAGELTVSRLKASAAEGQLDASFRAAADGDRIVTSGTLQGADIVLGNTQENADGPSFPKQNLWLEFTTEGATVRDLAANLDGYLQLIGGAGRMKNNRALDLFGDFYTELLSAINPFVVREPYTAISCFAAYAVITDGVAEIKPGAVMQTDKLNMFGRGKIDLETEQIQLRFDTSPRSGIGVSLADFVNPFVGVTGTLASPRLGVDPKNAMFEGGFAYATGGLSIVAKSLFNRWFGASDPCAELEKEAQEYWREIQLQREERVGDQPKPADGDR